MSLANIATLQALNRRTVLAVDFDLEAPGLHRYFLTPGATSGQTRYSPKRDQAGVDDGEEDLKRKWLERAKSELRPFVGGDSQPQRYFDMVRIPYRSHFAYGESLAVEEQPVTEMGSLAQAYSVAADVLEFASVSDVEHRLVENRREIFRNYDLPPLLESLLGAIRVAPANAAGSADLFDGTISLLEPHGFERNRPEVAELFAKLGDSLGEVGAVEKAQEAYRRVLSILEAAGSSHPLAADVRARLARLDAR